MTAYTVNGHPLGPAATTGLPESLHDLLQTNGVGATVNITLSGPDDTKAKAHNVLK